MDNSIEILINLQSYFFNSFREGDVCLFLSGEQMCCLIYEIEKCKPYPILSDRLKTPIIIHTKWGKITGVWDGE